jgi:hypothetical protein
MANPFFTGHRQHGILGGDFGTTMSGILLLGLRPAIPVRVRAQDFDVSKALVDPITNQHKEE